MALTHPLPPQDRRQSRPPRRRRVGRRRQVGRRQARTVRGDGRGLGVLRRTVGTAGPCLVLVGAAAVWMTLSPDARITTTGQLLLKISCAAILVVGIRRHRPPVASPWWFLVAYFVLVAVRNVRRVLLAWTDGTWSVLQGNEWEMTFSVLGSALLVTSVWIVLVRRRRGAGAWALDDSVVLVVGVGLAALLMISIPTFREAGAGVVFWNVGVVNVARDVLTLIPALSLLCSEPLRASGFSLFSTALVVMPLADLVWLRSSASGDVPSWAHITVMTALSGSQLLVGVAALHPSMREIATPSTLSRSSWTPGRTLVLGLAVVAPTLAVLVWSDLSETEFAVATAGLALLLAAFLWRLRRAVLRAHDLVGQVQFLADHDQLTSLPNRRHLYGGFRTTLLEQVARSGPVTLFCCYLDLDNLREVNDRFEHNGGDLLLQTVAHLLLEASAPFGSTVVRLGGDEFVVLTVAAGVQPAARFDEVAVALTEAVNGVHDVPSGLVHASVGSSRVVLQDRPVSLRRQLDAVIHEADLAQGVSKRAGGGRWTAFESTIGARSVRRAAIRQALPWAWERGEMTLDYQPVVDLSTGELFGTEALLRWHHPELGTVPPSEAVEVAEELGLISEIGLRILQQGLRDLTAQDLPSDIRIGVDVSARQLRPGAVDHLVDRLIDSGLARRVWVEVSEQRLVEDRDRLLGPLADLRAAGVLIAVDDFGTGHSGLDHLCTLPVDIVKLDGVFAREAERSPTRRRMALLAVQLAEAVGAIPIAGGLDTGRMATVMAELGFTHGQGRALGLPGPVLRRPTSGRVDQES